jgi:hypothetical protein
MPGDASGPGDIPSWQSAGRKEPSKRPRRRLRLILISLGALLAVLLIVLALAPTIAGSIAPGYLRDALNKSIHGKADVGGISLSWFGGQRIGPVTITDSAGQAVARVTVNTSRGLAGLARGALGLGALDLGQSTITGSAIIVRRPDGTTNLQEVFGGPAKPAANGGGGGGSGGASSRSSSIPIVSGSVVLDKLDVRFIDQSRPGAPAAAIVVPALSGTASIQGSKAADASLTGNVLYGTDEQHATTPGGSVALDAHADSLTDGAGRLTLSATRFDVKADAKDVAVVIADAAAGMDQRLVAAVGDTLQASVRAAGTLADADATITAASRAINADVALKSAGGVLTTPRPGKVTVQTSGFPAFLSGADKSLASGQTAKFDKLPEVTAVIDNLKVTLPSDGKPLDLRGAAVSLALDTTEATGTVSLPTADGKTGPAQPFRIAPFKANLEAQDLAQKVTITGGTSATIAGQSAGTLAIDLAAVEPLDAAGRIKPGVPGRIQGSLNLTGVATAIAQPLADAAGIDLSRDVGPQLDLALRAAATDEELPAPAAGAAAPASGTPPTHLALDVKSANINGTARVLLDQRILTTKPKGIDLKINSVGPLATKFLKPAGVSLDSGGPVEVTVTNLRADLDRLSKPGAGPDLRAVSGLVTVQTGAMAGRFAMTGQPRAFEIAPLSATVDAADLSKGAAIKAATTVTLDKAPAGTLDVDLKATGLVNADGTPTQRLPALEGRVGLTGISTSLAQPWVESAGLDLPAGVGPKLDVQLTAAPATGSGPPGGQGPVPATDLDVKVRSAGLNSDAALTLDGRTIRKRGADTELTLRSPATLVGKAARASGVAMSDGGYFKLTAHEYAVVFDQAWKPRLDQSTASVEINTGGYSLAPIPPAPSPESKPIAASAPAPQPSPAPAPAEPLALNQFITTVTLAPGKNPAVDFKGSGSHQKAAFFTQGALELPGLFTADPSGAVAVTPAKVRPVGTIDVNNLPTSLAALAIAAPPAGKGFDTARLIREAVGPTVTVKASALPRNTSPIGRDVALNLQAERFNGGLAAAADEQALAVSKLDFRGQVTPDLAGALIDMLGPGLASRPTLVSPATITISATPFTVPLAGGAPSLASAPHATLKIGLEGRALVNNVLLKSDSGPPRDIGAVGLENVLVTATVPLSSLAEGGAARPAQLSITGGVLGGPDKRVVDLKGDGHVPIAGGRPAGDLGANFNLSVLDAAWIDSFLGRPGLVAGGIGDTATLDAAATVQFPKPPPAGTTAPATAAAFDRATVSGNIKSPRLSTSQPFKATIVPDRLTLDSPTALKWSIDPAWANAYVLGARTLKPGDPPPPARFGTPLDVTVQLTKLTLAMGPGTGPLKPGVFAADAQLSSPGATLLVGPAQSPTPSKLTNLRARVSSGKEAGAVGFSLSVDDAGAGAAPGGKPAVDLAGGIYSIADAAGNLTLDNARITMNGSAIGVPSAVVDALAHQKGVLAEALGPTVNVKVTTQGASEAGGAISAEISAPRAEANLKGQIHNGMFVADGPVQVSLKQITPALGRQLMSGLPIVGTFEKKPEDGPAVLRATGLTVPLDDDLRKLNGQVVFDLGQARFETSGVFAEVLKITGQKSAGTVGRRLEPINVDIKSGVATYDRVTIPLGDFSFSTKGTVDLVNRKLDVTTFVPFGALTDEAAGMFNTGLGKALGGALPTIEKATMVPFRTTGSFDKPDTRPDLEVFAKQLGKTLLRPDQLIGGSLKDALKKLGGK